MTVLIKPLRSSTLLALAFLYSAICLFNIHGFLPQSDSGKDPYEAHHESPFQPSRFLGWSVTSDQTPRISMPGLDNSKGQGQSAKLQPEAGPELTFTTWLRFEQRQQAATQCLASYGNRWAIVIQEDRSLSLFIQAGARRFAMTTIIVAPAMAWTHAAVTFSTVLDTLSDFAVYINGTVAASTAYAPALNASLNNPRVRCSRLGFCNAVAEIATNPLLVFAGCRHDAVHCIMRRLPGSAELSDRRTVHRLPGRHALDQSSCHPP